MTENTKPDHAGVRFPPPLVYALGVGLGAWLDHVAPLFTYAPWPAHIGAIACAALWGSFAGSAIGLFRRAHTSIIPIRPASALVTSGVYRITRNPMYVSLVFLYLAVSLWFGFAWPLVFLPVVIAIVHAFVIKPEERYLQRRFGQVYLDYQGRVRRWL